MFNHSPPSLAVLSAVLLFLPGCGGVETGQEGSEASLVVEELAKTTHSWDGELLPAYPAGQPMITIQRVHIPAGARLDPHTHPVIAAGVLLSGQLTVVTVDGETLHLEAGDPIVEVVNTVHHGVNEGQEPAEIIAFYAGIEGEPITVPAPQ